MIRLLAFTLILSTFFLPQMAEAEGLRGIKGKDDRVLIENYKYPWSAIGRINKESGGFCTGTLVAPRLVLTAAHCLWNKKRQVWLTPDMIHFLPGYRRGNFIAHSRGKKFHISPKYNPKKGKELSVASLDWAFVELQEDLGKLVGTIPIAAVNKKIYKTLIKHDIVFTQAGYSQDKAHILSVNSPCKMKGYNSEFNVIAHGCDAVHGDSGSPIFYELNGKTKIAYIHVATTKEGESIGIAISGIKFANHLKQLGLWDRVQASVKPSKL